MNGIGKGIGIALVSLCFLMATMVSPEYGSGSLAAPPSIKHANASMLLTRKASEAQANCNGARGRDRDGARTFLLGPKNSWPCLQKNIKPGDVVSAAPSKPGNGRGAQVTVDQTLRRLTAHCRRGKLVDANGREIYFYRLNGCWGNPPEDYQEILQRQSEELQKLKKHYHVIEMTCNPSGGQIQ